MCSLHLTHPSTHTLGAVGSRHCGAGEQLGVRCLAQGSHLSHWQFLQEPRDPRPRITSPTLYPLGHDCPNYVPLPFFFCLRQADLLTMHLSFFSQHCSMATGMMTYQGKKNMHLWYISRTALLAFHI